MDECYTKAREILDNNQDLLELMKDALMEYETIDTEQINDIMDGKKPRPPADWGDSDDSDAEASKVEKEKGDDSHKIGGPASEH